MCAFSLPTSDDRDELIRQLWQRAVIALPTGKDGVRFRPALTVSRAEIDAAIASIRAALAAEHPDAQYGIQDADSR
jgi:L-lysine 6-transaminase